MDIRKFADTDLDSKVLSISAKFWIWIAKWYPQLRICRSLLETYNDIPYSIRGQLYTKDNSRLEKRKKTMDSSVVASICPPININIPQLEHLNNRSLLLLILPRRLSWAALN